MTQAPLFPEVETRRHDGLPPFQRHSETSRAAAIAIAPNLNPLEKKVLAFLKRRGDFGATDEEAQLLLNMSGNTQRARRVRLTEIGLVADSGRQRETRAGRKAVVWIAKEKAAGRSAASQ